MGRPVYPWRRLFRFQALKQNPKDAETKYNLAYANAKLKEQQQNGGDKNKDNKDKKDDKKDKKDEQKDQNKDDKNKDQDKDQQSKKNQYLVRNKSTE